MANEPQNQPVVVDPTAHNAAVAATQATQDAAGHSVAGKPSDFAPVASALDELAAAKQKEIEAAAAAAPASTVVPAVTPAATPVETQVTPPAKTPEELAAEAEVKAKADAVAAESAAATQRAADVFKDVPQLPQNSAPKAAEAWNALKERAAKEILDREAKIAELTRQNTELTTRVSTPTTQQLEAEKQMKELSEWRAKLDLKFDPRFTGFDKQVSDIHDFVYAQLRKRADVVGENVIDEIKKFGGPENCNLEALFTKLKDPVLQRIVESKMSDALMLSHNKEQAMKDTEANMAEYMRQRQEFFTNAQTSHTAATRQNLDPMLHGLDWFKNPKEADKPALEKLKGELASALQDDSPQMRAILLTGYANMCHLQDVTKSQAAELTTVKAQLAEAQDLLNRVKGSSTSRLRESGASPNAQPAAPPKQNEFTTRPADALDALAAQVMATRVAKGAA
jgi:hypothetical protein